MTGVLTALIRIFQHIRLLVGDYDFGISSLKQLTRVPFTQLKIHQSFISGCTFDSDLFSIKTGSVIGGRSAKALGLKNLAEGIENQAEIDVLMDSDFDIVSGYFIFRPINQDSFLKE